MSWTTIAELVALGAAALHVVGLVSAVHAALWTRTSQGAIAWTVSLATFPYVAVPLYWILGRYKYRGYIVGRRRESQVFRHVVEALNAQADDFAAPLPRDRIALHAAEQLARMPFTRGNRARLLVDGEATFEALRQGIAAAQDYLLVQFFIWRDDELGRELRDRLVERASAGVRVWVLYDEIGSHALPGGFFAPLERAGGSASAFGTSRGFVNRFQLNFRNHRKVVVADGRVAWVGGHNVGVEYLGRDPRRGAWRDTHLEVAGPVVQGLQLAFMEDWNFAAGEVLELDLTLRAAEGGELYALPLPTGPADELETCWLAFVEAIHSARERIWITSPYFVPDEAVLSALQLAALEGVDVRILLPERPDHLLVWLSSFAFYDEVLPVGVKLYRYTEGFLHQKVMLIDQTVAAVGTANLDNRSFRLNFEVAVVTVGRSFAAEVEAMLERDFARSRRVGLDDLRLRSTSFRVAARLARLLAPIQ
jgi:cardiolipin synthase